MAVFPIFRKKINKKEPSKQETNKKRQAVSAPSENKEAKAYSSSLNQGEEENLILRPHFSEKATAMKKEGKYVFSVIPRAKKTAIKKAIEGIYNVKVVKVNILKSFSRPKKWIMKKTNFQKSKKVIVTLKEGQKIELGI